jgi:hypothetical protein
MKIYREDPTKADAPAEMALMGMLGGAFIDVGIKTGATQMGGADPMLYAVAIGILAKYPGTCMAFFGFIGWAAGSEIPDSNSHFVSSPNERQFLSGDNDCFFNEDNDCLFNL